MNFDQALDAIAAPPISEVSGSGYAKATDGVKAWDEMLHERRVRACALFCNLDPETCEVDEDGADVYGQRVTVVTGTAVHVHAKGEEVRCELTPADVKDALAYLHELNLAELISGVKFLTPDFAPWVAASVPAYSSPMVPEGKVLIVTDPATSAVALWASDPVLMELWDSFMGTPGDKP